MMHFFSKTNLLLVVIFGLSNEVLAGVGDTYVCKEKETNFAGYKAEFILYWNENSFEQKYKVEKGSVDTSTTAKFTIDTPDYFISIYPYQSAYESAYVTSSFDGMNFTNQFIDKDYTYVSSYDCEKF